MILGLSTICFGKDMLAKEYMIGGIRMAEELLLIGEHPQAIWQFNNESKDTLSLLCYVAWGAFNFSS